MLGREPINLQWSADVRFGAHNGLKSDIAPFPKSAKPVIREVQQDEGPRLRTARSKFLAGGVMVGFSGFV
jgi:hypothetical protein